jgi:demethylspheroidene O-methyltransferase
MEKTDEFFAEEAQNHIQMMREYGKGFFLTRILMSAFDLDLFILLKNNPLSLDEIVDTLHVQQGIARVFLNACTGVSLLEFKGDKYHLSKLSEAIMIKYDTHKSWAKEMDLAYRDLVNLTQFLLQGNIRDSETYKFWSYKQKENRKEINKDKIDNYSELMDKSSDFVIQLVQKAYDFSDHAFLIDMGGGYGSFVTTIAKAYPHLKLGIVDLPQACSVAKARILEKGLTKQIECYGRDFLKDPLPEGADIISVIRILWDWSDANVLKLLNRIHEVLPNGGKVMVVESMFVGDTAVDKSTSLSAMYIMLLGGKIRAQSEIYDLLKTAGFLDIETIDTEFAPWKIVTGIKNNESVLAGTMKNNV